MKEPLASIHHAHYSEAVSCSLGLHLRSNEEAKGGVSHGVETRSGHFIFLLKVTRYLMVVYYSTRDLSPLSSKTVHHFVFLIDCFFMSLTLSGNTFFLLFCFPSSICHSLSGALFSSCVSFTRVDAHVGALPVMNNVHQLQRSNGMGFAR